MDFIIGFVQDAAEAGLLLLTLIHQARQFLGHVEMLGGEHFPQVHADEPAPGDVQDFDHPGIGKDDAMVLIRHQESFFG